MPRVLGRIRLSRLTEESTSAARQREIIQQWADAHGHEVIGWAEDLDVSGSIDPFEAPALKPWLERPDGWDILCAWKLDRIARRSIPMHKLFGWVIEHDKTLVCVSDNIDLSTWVGRLVAGVIAGVAEGELEAIRERNKASRRKLLEDGRWPGGKPPFGFRAVRLEGGGWKLAHKPDEVAVIRRVVDLVCQGASVGSAAQECGVPPKVVWNLIDSGYLLGHATHNGRTVRGKDGLPVLYGEPVLSQYEWDRLRKAVEVRKRFQTRTSGVSPLYGVAFCPVCDRQLYPRNFHKAGKTYRYYFCVNKHGRGIPAEAAEKLVYDTFIEEFGGDPVLERVYVPAENHQIELEESRRAVGELSTLFGTITSDTMRSLLTEQMRALDSRISVLEKSPARQAGWKFKETGSTFKSVWSNSSQEEKRKLIIDKNISARMLKDNDGLNFYIVVNQEPDLPETQKSPPK